MNGEYFETANTNLAAWLRTNGIPFRGVSVSGNYVSFRFTQDDRISDLINAFTADGQCNIKDYCANHRFLSLQIREAKRNGGLK